MKEIKKESHAGLKKTRLIIDYSKLKGKIVENCGTRKNFAKEMGLSERSISLKLNSKVDFSQTEIAKALSILNIQPSEIDEYFFRYKKVL